jgi:hypothetical protein
LTEIGLERSSQPTRAICDARPEQTYVHESLCCGPAAPNLHQEPRLHTPENPSNLRRPGSAHRKIHQIPGTEAPPLDTRNPRDRGQIKQKSHGPRPHPLEASFIYQGPSPHPLENPRGPGPTHRMKQKSQGPRPHPPDGQEIPGTQAHPPDGTEIPGIQALKGLWSGFGLGLGRIFQVQCVLGRPLMVGQCRRGGLCLLRSVGVSVEGGGCTQAMYWFARVE